MRFLDGEVDICGYRLYEIEDIPGRKGKYDGAELDDGTLEVEDIEAIGFLV
jgi:hypothetical protein